MPEPVPEVPFDPNLKGDVQGTEVGAYLRNRIETQQFDAFCIDCQNNRSSHCVVTFGIFVCADCAYIHNYSFSMMANYTKSLFDESWDTFQLACVQKGGNQRFFEFMKIYGKEREPIIKKYDTKAATYYRRRLVETACGKEFTEEVPAKNF